MIVDVAVDQGGCVETIKPTTHENPTYVVDGVIHYGVANMPGGVPRTSTLALTNATLPYAMQLAGKGWKRALARERRPAQGTEHRRREGDVPGRGRGFRHGVTRSREASWLKCTLSRDCWVLVLDASMLARDAAAAPAVST